MNEQASPAEQIAAALASGNIPLAADLISQADTTTPLLRLIKAQIALLAGDITTARSLSMAEDFPRDTTFHLLISAYAGEAEAIKDTVASSAVHHVRAIYHAFLGNTLEMHREFLQSLNRKREHAGGLNAIAGDAIEYSILCGDTLLLDYYQSLMEGSSADTATAKISRLYDSEVHIPDLPRTVNDLETARFMLFLAEHSITEQPDLAESILSLLKDSNWSESECVLRLRILHLHSMLHHLSGDSVTALNTLDSTDKTLPPGVLRFFEADRTLLRSLFLATLNHPEKALPAIDSCIKQLRKTIGNGLNTPFNRWQGLRKPFFDTVLQLQHEYGSTAGLYNTVQCASGLEQLRKAVRPARALREKELKKLLGRLKGAARDGLAPLLLKLDREKTKIEPFSFRQLVNRLEKLGQDEGNANDNGRKTGK